MTNLLDLRDKYMLVANRCHDESDNKEYWANLNRSRAYGISHELFVQLLEENNVHETY